MTTRRLTVDFVATRPVVTWGGGLLLAAGVCAAAAAVSDYRGLTRRIAALELRQAELEPARPAESGPATSLGLQDAKEAVLELRTPWAELLGQLEAVGSESRETVALLAIEPDPAANRVRLVAEAKSLVAALRYVSRLQGCTTLRNPLLQSHEINTRDRERPVRFEISADWRLEP